MVYQLLNQQDNVKVINAAPQEAERWRKFVSDINSSKSGSHDKTFSLLQELNKELLPKVFLTAVNGLTHTDVEVLHSLTSVVSKLSDKERAEVCNVVRWYDYVQHLLQRLDPNVTILPLGKGQASSPTEKDVEPSKKANDAQKEPAKKEQPVPKKTEQAQQEKPKEQASEKKEQPVKKEQPAQKEKKEQPAKGKAAPKAAAPAAESSDFAKVDIRVGHVISVKKHPSADNLYVEEIDLGESAPRTIISGLVKHVPETELLNSNVLVICNLKPRKMQGIDSNGMVLCASTDDKGVVELLVPPAGVKPGERITVEGEDGEPEAELNPKKKQLEKVLPELKTDDEKRACYKGKPFKTSQGFVFSKTLKGGNIN
eukprot:TRINITY_DN3979_c0_g2_i1.p1 TRINITY_DN3979_c0_g2~~TRINITY_DN3979_c0_g2_i1.p1  ORF type:complete len:370 (+),score=101.59 TRINITY_DN3979_c0_g2_i1:61-1170(+)